MTKMEEMADLHIQGGGSRMFSLIVTVYIFLSPYKLKIQIHWVTLYK